MVLADTAAWSVQERNQEKLQRFTMPGKRQRLVVVIKITLVYMSIVIIISVISISITIPSLLIVM